MEGFTINLNSPKAREAQRKERVRKFIYHFKHGHPTIVSTERYKDADTGLTILKMKMSDGTFSIQCDEPMMTCHNSLNILAGLAK